MLLPTPPLPERTKILCLTALNFSAIVFMAGLTVRVPEEQAPWLGQPWQAYCFPACSDYTPGQCSLALLGTYLSIQ